MPDQKVVKQKKSRFAFIVGANYGGEDRVRLRYAVSDAMSMQNLFTQMGGMEEEECIVLENPNRKQFMAEMKVLQKKIKQAKNAEKKVETIFYYSGHSDERYIFLGKERISYKEFRELIEVTDADVKIAILDSCASGAFTRLKGGKKTAPLSLDDAYNMKGFAFMTSSSLNESSQESDRIRGSFFTHYLVSGMRGAADMTGDGRVTLTEAYQFAFNQTLSQTEKTMSGPQHPNYNIQMAGTGDVVMTEIRRSKSVLILGKKTYGRMFIHNQDDLLVVELSKPLGRTIELGLEQGRYRIINIRDGRIFESDCYLKKNHTYNLHSHQFSEGQKLPTTTRGVEPKPIDLPKKEEMTYAHRPFEFSFLALPGFKNRTVNSFSLNIISSRCSNLKGLSIGSGVAMVDETVNGAQLAGIGNFVGGDTKYFQLAGLFNSNLGNVTGLQAAGLVNFTRRELIGVQTTGLISYAYKVKGLQASGLTNFVLNEAKGAQIAGLLNMARVMTGAQVGVANAASYIEGAQVGVFNIGGQVEGCQIGLFNIAKNVELYSLGLFNFILKGKTSLNLWMDDLGFWTFGIKHGTRKFYNLYMLGTDGGFDRGLFGLGYGITIKQKGNLRLSTDLLVRAIFPKGELFSDGIGLFSSLRFVLDYELSSSLILQAGLSCNYYNEFDDNGCTGSISIPKPFHKLSWKGSDSSNRFWPGLFIGVEVPVIKGKKK
jgi:hypothetical protein